LERALTGAACRAITKGVGFRYHMCRVAQELGVTGWVRNRRGGSGEFSEFGTLPTEGNKVFRRFAQTFAQVKPVFARRREGTSRVGGSHGRQALPNEYGMAADHAVWNARQTLLTALTTFSTVKPKYLNSSPAGADSP